MCYIIAMRNVFEVGKELLEILEIRPSTASLVWEVAKLVCLIRDNYTCKNCGYTETGIYGLGKTKLIVHHLDKSGTDNNPNHKLENLETLCYFCHHLAHSPKYISGMSLNEIPTNAQIVRILRQENPTLTMTEIGRRVELTKERVRQILKKAGLPTRRMIVKLPDRIKRKYTRKYANRKRNNLGYYI